MSDSEQNDPTEKAADLIDSGRDTGVVGVINRFREKVKGVEEETMDDIEPQEEDQTEDAAEGEEFKAGPIERFREKLGVETKGDWVPYEGPQGGSGWKNTETGKVSYDDNPPGNAMDMDEVKDGIRSVMIMQDDDLGSIRDELESSGVDLPDGASDEDIVDAYIDEMPDNALARQYVGASQTGSVAEATDEPAETAMESALRGSGIHAGDAKEVQSRMESLAASSEDGTISQEHMEGALKSMGYSEDEIESAVDGIFDGLDSFEYRVDEGEGGSGRIPAAPDEDEEDEGGDDGDGETPVFGNLSETASSELADASDEEVADAFEALLGPPPETIDDEAREDLASSMASESEILREIGSDVEATIDQDDLNAGMDAVTEEVRGNEDEIDYDTVSEVLSSDQSPVDADSDLVDAVAEEFGVGRDGADEEKADPAEKAAGFIESFREGEEGKADSGVDQKAKVYVDSPEEVPPGREPQQGPGGGLYYETGGDVQDEEEQEEQRESALDALPGEAEGDREEEQQSALDALPGSKADPVERFREKLGLEKKAGWVPYEGPEGGSGWQNPETGDITYSEEPPGEALEPGEITREDLEGIDDPGTAGQIAAAMGVEEEFQEDLAAELGLPEDASAEEAAEAIEAEPGALAAALESAQDAAAFGGDGDSGGDDGPVDQTTIETGDTITLQDGTEAEVIGTEMGGAPKIEGPMGEETTVDPDNIESIDGGDGGGDGAATDPDALVEEHGPSDVENAVANALGPDRMDEIISTSNFGSYYDEDAGEMVELEGDSREEKTAEAMEAHLDEGEREAVAAELGEDVEAPGDSATGEGDVLAEGEPGEETGATPGRGAEDVPQEQRESFDALQEEYSDDEILNAMDDTIKREQASRGLMAGAGELGQDWLVEQANAHDIPATRQQSTQEVADQMSEQLDSEELNKYMYGEVGDYGLGQEYDPEMLVDYELLEEQSEKADVPEPVERFRDKLGT